MSLSYECVCKTCGKEFDAWCREYLCSKCTKYKKIKDLPLNRIINVTDSGGGEHTHMFVKDLLIFGEMDIVENDPDFQLILYHDELQALSNHLGHEIKIR